MTDKKVYSKQAAEKALFFQGDNSTNENSMITYFVFKIKRQTSI